MYVCGLVCAGEGLRPFPLDGQACVGGGLCHLSLYVYVYANASVRVCVYVCLSTFAYGSESERVL